MVIDPACLQFQRSWQLLLCRRGENSGPKKRGEHLHSPRHGGSLFGVHRSGTVSSPPWALLRQLQGHLLQRFEKIDQFPMRERVEDPGVISANKAPAIPDKAIHRVTDNKVGMSAGINAIVLGPASHVIGHWTGAYHTYIMSLYIGVESKYGSTQDI